MPTATQTPHSYRSARIDRLLRTSGSPDTFPAYLTELGSFDQATDQAGRLITYLIAGIEQLAADDFSDIGTLARAEFFWKHERTTPFSYRGVVLFDNRGRAIMHVIHALLGYGGNGPVLSELILNSLGVPKGLFDEANRAVNHHDYVVVFSRECHREVMGIDTALPFAKPGEWEWWRVR